MNEFLKGILDGINLLTHNYGWSVVVFTILIRLILTPFDVKSRVAMRKTTKLQPQINALQKKYAKDQQKLNMKMQELYKKEKVNPLSSCLPLLLSWPILLAMFTAMRMVANEQMVKQTFEILQGMQPTLEPWLWIKNIWMPDSPFVATWPDLTRLQQVPADIWLKVFSELPADVAGQLTQTLSLTADSFARDSLRETVQTIYASMSAMPAYAEQLATIPGFTFNLIITSLTVFRHYNGFFILPLLSAASQYLMTVLQPAQPAADGQTKQSGGTFMKWFFPLFSLWICAGYYAAFAIYWMVSNILAIVENLIINWVLDRKERLAAAAQEEVK